MTANELFRAAFPGVIAGCVLWTLGTLVGLILEPGWKDIFQGLSVVVAVVWIAVSVVRKALSIKRSQQ